ncbi:MAG: protein-disulfide reductase DsbD family protein [Pseudohongiellaceae bacterium]|nr:protein-disulfide reductase DsbD family protein [Pseudohongiellaceae bacterium]
MRKLVSTLLVLGSLFPIALQAEVFYGEEIEVELVSESSNAVPGETLWLGLRLDPTEHWHTYSRWQGDSGEATRLIDWELPEGAQVGELQFPTPTWLPFPGSDLVTFAYEKEVLLPISVTVPADFTGDTFDASALAQWQVCDEICLLGETRLSISIPVTGDALVPDPQWTQAFAETRADMPIQDDGLEAMFAVAGERISFSFLSDDAMFAGASNVWFFPETKRTLKPGPLRDVSINPVVTQITHAQARRLRIENDRVNGVLAVEQPDGEVTGYLVSAEPATPEKLADITAMAGSASSDDAAGGGPGLLTVMLFALVGGLILNLMPCVFPVLSLKVLSFASKGDAEHRVQRLHGLSYTAGIILTFMTLASVLLVLRAGGEAVGWAFQLQSPWFVAILIYLFFTMALSLSGVFEIGTSVMGVGDKLATQSGYKGSFFTGVLATVVASPCTAPFMGAALGFALSQSWLIAMVVFAFLGLGMALPFLLLSFSPALLKYMPKPGSWMNTFKEFMAFPMYATVLWLLWVLGMQVGVNGMAIVVGSCLLIAFGLWLLRQRPTVGPFWKVANAAICAVAVIAAFAALRSPMFLAHNSTAMASSGSEAYAETSYEAFSAAKLADLRAQDKPVFINMTAAWCITCLANEQTTLSTARVGQALQDNNITYLKGDWTNQDPEISHILDEFNHPSVPLYVLYPGGGRDPIVLPQILTPSIVVNTFNSI